MIQSKIPTAVFSLGIGLGWMFLTACGPPPLDDSNFLDHRRDPSAAVFRSSELNSIDGAIELVQEMPAPDPDFDGDTATWIHQLRQDIEHTVLFPNWEGQRKGANQFTVRYVHIEIDFDYNMEHVGYEWQVDTMLKQVEGPVPLVPDDIAPDSPNIPTLNGLDSMPEMLDL